MVAQAHLVPAVRHVPRCPERFAAAATALRDDWSPEQVLDALLAGVKDKTVKVTLPEGKNMLEYFALVEQAGVAKASGSRPWRGTRVPAAPRHLGRQRRGLPLPRDLRLPVAEKPERVLGRIIGPAPSGCGTSVTRNAKALQRIKDRMKWSDRDVLIMASLVEKEAVASGEQPRIAQVFINRLTSPSFHPRRLGTDPTIRYGCMVPLQKSKACQGWDPAGEAVLRAAQGRRQPVQHVPARGPAAGPICNPGRGAIGKLRHRPDGSNYFYFVSRNDGTHVFSKTLAEHERGVDKYQR